MIQPLNITFYTFLVNLTLFDCMILRENNYNLSARRLKGKKSKENALSQGQATLVSNSNIIEWGRVWKFVFVII